MNSGFASLVPDFPREPVYLVNTAPHPTNAEFIFSNTSGKVGSKPAQTSAERHFEFARRRAGDILAANCSPTPSSDKDGATAIIRSYCKADLSKIANGAALDIKLLPTSVEGEDGIEAIIALMRGFVELGGFFMQPDVVDAEILKAARENPEDYKTLSVRVSGWNARFITLNDEWQKMIIEQNGGTV